MFNNQINLYNQADIQQIKESSLLVGKTLGVVAEKIAPGVFVSDLDRTAEQFIRDHQAIPSFKGYNGYPASLCMSINDVVVHGIPKNQILKEGDIVSIDCGVYKNGYHGDYAYTFAVGEISEEKRNLVERTKQSLYLGIEKAEAGMRTGDIGHAIQSYVESFGYGVVRELCGHGIGRNLHESPEILNYGRPGKGVLLKKGMVFCIEPMINMKDKAIFMENDGWTIRTKDGAPSAHFEHQIALTDQGTEILSTYKYIEEVLNKK
ncbi:MAG: type I methionyl aminopeptidase [Bacteroidales bacterium]|jgi:methionyl aminopeptidase|nr:type I methionyl aminopeptidase [Bacteroidales bacterium]